MSDEGYWRARRRAALTEAAAIQRYLDGRIDSETLHIELQRADSRRPTPLPACEQERNDLDRMTETLAMHHMPNAPELVNVKIETIRRPGG